MKVNLNGFCDTQKMVWEKYVAQLTESSCQKCDEKALEMTSKWKATCSNCETRYSIKKPKNFPKNMNNKRNWKASCDECGGKMDFYDNGHRMAYICNKCNNVLEV